MHPRPPLGGGTHQLVGHHELRRSDELRLDPDHARPIEVRQIDNEADLAIAVALERSAQTLAAIDRLGELDLGLLSSPALNIDGPDERAIDTGRGNLKPVVALNEVIGFEHRRQLARDNRALVDVEIAVLALGHDLDGVTVTAGDRDTHEPEAQLAEHRLGKIGNAAGKASLAAESPLGRRRTTFNCRAIYFRHGDTASHRKPMAQNKKSGPEGSLSKLR